jgi:hypothetical protein
MRRSSTWLTASGAEFFADKDDNVRQVFSYLACLQRIADHHKFLEDYSGFECHVEGQDAVAWVTACRPHLLTHADWPEDEDR